MNATRTGSLIGTPLYMSPEQCRGLPTISHSSDIYSLGCVLFEMVVATPPFSGAGPGDILMGHMAQTPPAMSALQAGVPPEIDVLVSHMLAKEPSQRPQSMAQVVGAMEEFLGLRCSEFGKALAWPIGFPNSPALTPTKVLTPADAFSGRWTPPPPKPANRSGASTSSPGNTVADPSLLGMASPEAGVRDETITALVHPWRTWVVAVAAVVALVVVASGVYFLTRPSSVSRRPSERPAETLAPPAPSQQAVNRVEPIQPAPSLERIPSSPSPADIGRGTLTEPPVALPSVAHRPTVVRPIEHARPRSKKQPPVESDESRQYERVGD
jgi:serine/threonine-protein kinase